MSECRPVAPGPPWLRSDTSEGTNEDLDIRFGEGFCASTLSQTAMIRAEDAAFGFKGSTGSACLGYTDAVWNYQD